MSYTGNLIVYLDADLADDAEALRKAMTGSVDVMHWGYGQGFVPSAPIATVKTNGRLVIMGHGDPNSTSIGNANFDPGQLAVLVGGWLGAGKRFKRISLDMCWGGGNRGAGVGHDSTTFALPPSKSFGYKFACIAHALTAEVSARTGVTAGKQGLVDSKAFHTRTVDGRHRTEGDKVIFVTSAQAPTIRFTWLNDWT